MGGLLYTILHVVLYNASRKEASQPQRYPPVEQASAADHEKEMYEVCVKGISSGRDAGKNFLLFSLLPAQEELDRDLFLNFCFLNSEM